MLECQVEQLARLWHGGTFICTLVRKNQKLARFWHVVTETSTHGTNATLFSKLIYATTIRNSQLSNNCVFLYLSRIMGVHFFHTSGNHGIIFWSEYSKTSKWHWYCDIQNSKVWMCEQGVNVYIFRFCPQKKLKRCDRFFYISCIVMVENWRIAVRKTVITTAILTFIQQ